MVDSSSGTGPLDPCSSREGRRRSGGRGAGRAVSALHGAWLPEAWPGTPWRGKARGGAPASGVRASRRPRRRRGEGDLDGDLEPEFSLETQCRLSRGDTQYRERRRLSSVPPGRAYDARQPPRRNRANCEPGERPSPAGHPAKEPPGAPGASVAGPAGPAAQGSSWQQGESAAATECSGKCVRRPVKRFTHTSNLDTLKRFYY